MKKTQKFNPNIILSIILLAGIALSIVKIAMAVAPNPGHNFTEVSGGITTGQLIYGSATDVFSALSDVAVGSYLRSGGVGVAPLWSTPTLPNTATNRKVMIGNGTNWVESTETYAVPGTAGNLMESDGTNWVSAAGGVLIARQVLTTGTTYTPTAGTNSVVIQMCGGGGGGSGATGSATPTGSFGGGGGSGSYAEKRFAGIAGAASYTIAIGGAGTGGLAANGAGGNGGITTFACPASCTGGAVTVTANGGTGAPATTAAGTSILSSLGGAGGVVSTLGDLNATGQPGGYSVRFSGSTGVTGGGGGGAGHFGGGGNSRNTAGAGNAGGNFCSGGGGAMSVSTTGVAGGAGTGGAMVIWEFR